MQRKTLALAVTLALAASSFQANAQDARDAELAALKQQLAALVEKVQELEARTDAQSDVNVDTATQLDNLSNNVAKVEKGLDIRFQPGFGLDTAGSGSTRRMMAYVKSDTRLVMHVPLALRFLAPQLVGLSVQVPGEYKYSGVEFRYPKSAYYMDGI